MNNDTEERVLPKDKFAKMMNVPIDSIEKVTLSDNGQIKIHLSEPVKIISCELNISWGLE